MSGLNKRRTSRFIVGVLSLCPGVISTLAFAQDLNECHHEKILPVDGGDIEAFGQNVELNDTFLFVRGDCLDLSTWLKSEYVSVRKPGAKFGAVVEVDRLFTTRDVPQGQRSSSMLALDGDVLVVGASTDTGAAPESGAAYVFRFNEATQTWNAEDKLFASDGAEHDFTRGIAVSGDVVLIGSLSHQHDNIPGGAAHVFRHDGVNWIEEAELLASDRASDDVFGISATLSGNVAIIGASKDDDNGINSGSVYVFKKLLGNWTQVGKIIAPDGVANDEFGFSLDYDGTTLAVGAPKHDYGRSDVGAVYLFTDDGSPDWLFKAKILPPLNADNHDDEFGRAVDIDDDQLAISALTSSGAGHVYRQIGSTWSHVTRMLAGANESSTNHYGLSIAMHGDTVVVGAANDSEVGDAIGAVFIHTDIFITDCNDNCIDDNDEIAAGDDFDCNANGVLDQCDLTDLTSVDCNNNLIPDDCEDCNDNGQADECELAGLWVVQSPQLGPIGFGSTVSHTIIAPRPALSDVTLDLSSNADLEGSFKYIDLYLNDDFLGRIFNGAGSEGCPIIPDLDVPEFDQVVIPMADYQALVGAGNATFRFESDTFLATACVDPSWVQFQMSYTGPPTTPDVNVNGIPDECDFSRGDNNLDGVINVSDLLNLITRWGPCPDPCPEDTNLDGVVNVTDLLTLITNWG